MLQYPFSCFGCTSSCGVLTNGSGTLSQKLEGTGLAADANCMWIIAPGGAREVKVTFSFFSTGQNTEFVLLSECSDMHCSSTRQLASLSGNLLLASAIGPTYSTTGFMLVSYKAYRNLPAEKFTLSWTSNNLPPVRIPLSLVGCDVIVNEC